jgi:hypothetical protein
VKALFSEVSATLSVATDNKLANTQVIDMGQNLCCHNFFGGVLVLTTAVNQPDAQQHSPAAPAYSKSD